MSSRRGRGLLHPQSGRVGSRGRAGNSARSARSQHPDEYAHDHRPLHAVRKARLHRNGAGLMGSALKGKALIAYLVVCVFWGSTYLAIKVGVTELPPFLFAGLRFLIGGLVLLTLARALGDPLPRKNDWRTLAIVGLLLRAGGNAFVG